MPTRWMLLAVVVLGGFQCPQTTPPVPGGVQCTNNNDGSGGTLTVSWGADSLVMTAPVSATSTAGSSVVLKVRGEPLVSFDIAYQGTRRSFTARFGKAVSGVREMVVTTTDDESFTGTFDGKPLKPFTKKAVPNAFADGSPLPPVTVDENTKKELQAFVKVVQAAPDACTPKTADGSRPLFADNAVPGVAYDRFFGDFPNPGNCLRCWFTSVTIAYTCMFATFNVCEGWPPCIVAGAVNCVISSRVYLVSQCFDPKPGPCCAKFCGAVCCGIDEACLGLKESALGYCCPPNTTACPTPLVPDGPARGTVCCPQGNVCDNTTATCCPPGQKACGTGCCPHCDYATGKCCNLGDASCDVCGGVQEPCCYGQRCLSSDVGCSLATNTCGACPSQQTTKTLVNTVLHQGNNLGGTDHWYVCQKDGTCTCTDCTTGLYTGAPIACDSGFSRGTCSATRVSADNGSVCVATWQSRDDTQDCTCVVRAQSPGGTLDKFVDCCVTVNEVQAPIGCQYPAPPASTCGRANVGDPCSSNDQCATGRCDAGFNTTNHNKCTCATPSCPNGSYCTYDNQCQSGWCTAFGGGEGTCAALHNVGQPCSGNNQCSTGRCDAGFNTTNHNKCTCSTPSCPNGSYCTYNNQCQSGRCSASGGGEGTCF